MPWAKALSGKTIATYSSFRKPGGNSSLKAFFKISTSKSVVSDSAENFRDFSNATDARF